jgi:hypothetical protein
MKSKMAVDQVLKRFSGKIVKEDASKVKKSVDAQLARMGFALNMQDQQDSA